MFANPLALVALLAVPAVIALHLLRRRFQPRVVSALFLWVDHDRDPAEGRRWERLRASASLILETLAALFLALALAGPRGCDEGGSHTIIVLDGSASMAAIGADGQTGAERARALVEARLSDLSARDRVTLLESGPRARVLAGPEALADEGARALERWDPAGPGADPADTLALARALGGGAPILFVTDHAPDESPRAPELEVRSVGEAANNVGFIDATRVRGEVSLTLASFSSAAAEGQIVVEGSPPLPFRLEPGATRPLRLSLPGGATLQARLEKTDGAPWQDALALDDRVLLAPPPSRPLRLGSALPAAMNRALGLSAGPGDALGVGRWVAAVPGSVASPADQADLALALPGSATAEGAWVFVISGPSSPEERSEERALIGPFLSTGHPLLAGFSGEGLIWTPGVAATVGADDQPLLLAGTRALLLAHSDGARFTLDIHPWKSTLARSLDWPLLLSNLAALRREALPGPRQTNLRAGEALRWPGAGSGESVVSGPDARTVQTRGELILEDLRPGEHHVRVPEGEAQTVMVNLLSPGESELRSRAGGAWAASAAGRQASLVGGGAATALGLAALALLLLDWALLNRRER